MRVYPGAALAFALAAAARFLEPFVHPIPDVIIALAFGAALGNIKGVHGVAQVGARYVLFYVLRLAIILLGAGLSVTMVARLGVKTIVLVAVCVGVAIVAGIVLARLNRLRPRIGTLIGVGTAICGGSAILAVAPLIEATEAEIAYAISTIFTFNIVALLTYPVIGHALHLGQVAFGTWTGTAVNDTSVVVATGYVYGATAGITATVVKLTRTLFLVPLALGIGIANRIEGGLASRMLQRFPWFILGFAVVAVANSAQLWPAEVSHWLVSAGTFLIVVVLAAVGLNINIVQLASLGARPLIVGFGLATTMAVFSSVLIAWLQIR